MNSWKNYVLKMERSWRANASRLPKMRPCCPSFYTQCWKLLSSFCCVWLLFLSCLWVYLDCWFMTQEWVLTSWLQSSEHRGKLNPEMGKRHRWKNARIKPRLACSGIYRWKWDGRKRRAGMVIWAWESKQKAEGVLPRTAGGKRAKKWLG